MGPVPSEQMKCPVLIFDPSPVKGTVPLPSISMAEAYVGRADTNLRLQQDLAQSTQRPVVSVDYTLRRKGFSHCVERICRPGLLPTNKPSTRIDGRDRLMGDSPGAAMPPCWRLRRENREIKFAFQCLMIRLDDRGKGPENRGCRHIVLFLNLK